MNFCLALIGCVLLTPILYGQEVQAGLYRPPAGVLVMRYAPASLDQQIPLEPMLHLYGRGFKAGRGSLEFILRAGAEKLHRGRVALDEPGEVFERTVGLPAPFPRADRLSWTVCLGGETWQGEARLRWSRFSGRLDYVDGRPRPSYIDLHPVTFAGGNFKVPVREDGSFAAQVPARVYAVANVNGAGYSVDAMERWAWDFDLTADREENFRVGRTELYGMKAFCLLAPTSTVFVVFRATALTRILQHAPERDARPKDDHTMGRIVEHLKLTPMAVAPELARENVKVRLDGVAIPVSDLSRVVETSGQGIDQTLYLLQFTPPQRPARGVRHEVLVEVESRDMLHGELVTDFGQGSAGLYLD
ncbi:MAG TPA: hypothetical protein PKK12_02935 [Candidatus Aminicenantes bacterium]|nr:hypothetical protein [Candidatus Aminicenantes bacterium]